MLQTTGLQAISMMCMASEFLEFISWTFIHVCLSKASRLLYISHSSYTISIISSIFGLVWCRPDGMPRWSKPQETMLWQSRVDMMQRLQCQSVLSASQVKAHFQCLKLWSFRGKKSLAELKVAFTSVKNDVNLLQKRYRKWERRYNYSNHLIILIHSHVPIFIWLLHIKNRWWGN